jgi:UDP-N-acetylmuramoyl-tripeptide--D-alanyl-D-alanine ligase
VIVALELAAVASLLVGFRAQLLRWLRVAQREHYLAGSVQEFRVRWTRSRPINLGAGIVSIALLLGSWVFRARFEALSVSCLIALGAIASLEPRGLTVKGRTSALAMTQRLRRVLLVTIGLSVVVVGFFGLVLDVPFGLAVATVGLPATIDNALRLLAPVERRSMQRFVDQAASTLRGVQPTVVAITGSYGKTSTKLHLTQLLSGSRAVVATPASFNNRGGLARAINEHLSYGTEVFIAEMGTYGPGEIADLC